MSDLRCSIRMDGIVYDRYPISLSSIRSGELISWSAITSFDRSAAPPEVVIEPTRTGWGPEVIFVDAADREPLTEAAARKRIPAMGSGLSWEDAFYLALNCESDHLVAAIANRFPQLESRVAAGFGLLLDRIAPSLHEYMKVFFSSEVGLYDILHAVQDYFTSPASEQLYREIMTITARLTR